MFNKKKGSKKILKRVLALLMVLMFTTTSMPVFGLDVWDDQPDNGNDIYFASSGEYGDSEFEPEAGYGDDYVADELGYDYGYDNGYNDENKEADYGYEADYDYKDKDEYESEEYGYEEKETVAATVTIIFEEDTLFVQQGSSFDLLEGVSAVDQDGENINVFVLDSGGFDINAEWPYNSFTITYAAIYPVSEAFFTAQRTVYVTMAITPLGTVPTWADATHFAGNDTELRNIISGAASGETRIIGITNNFNIDNNAQPVVNRNIEIPAGITIVLVAENAVELSMATSLSSGWRHFAVNGELILTDGVTLQGPPGNQAGGGVQVSSGGTFNMHDGAIRRGFPVAQGIPGGSVFVDGGTFNMYGGVISDSRSSSVVVHGGMFTMHDGELSGTGALAGTVGVLVSDSGTFEMKSGLISNYNASGVRIEGGSTFMMTGGEISGNMPASNGGGVYVRDNSTFTMEGGVIKDNTANNINHNNNGGGVFVSNSTFDMTGGEISGNMIGGGAGSTGGGGVAVRSGGTFTMTDGVIKDNRASNGNGGGVSVVNGTFTMNAGSIISDNTAGSRGGGVHVSDNGTFTMSGGEINDNVLTNNIGGGGGVSVEDDSTFTMTSGEINDNTAQHGGGVQLRRDGEFTMTGGEISGNTATSNSGGGGVHMWESTFTMTDGVIYGNTVSGNGDGGGVFMRNSSTVEMRGGVISGNNARLGGGVRMESDSTFEMSDGTISGNTARGVGGGGVNINGGAFTMEGGTISGNNASSNSGEGGGVFVAPGGIFTMEGGTISRNTAARGGGIFAGTIRGVPTRFNISDTSVFYGNVARVGAFNHGIANRGIGMYAHILWAGENSIPGTHLLNNFDMNYSNNPINNVRTVTFDAQGGTPTPTPQTVLNNGFATVPNPALELTDHALVGWRLSGATTNFDFANTPITNNITLYAEWEPAGGGTECDWLRFNDAIQTAGVNRVIIHPAYSISGVIESQVGDVFNLVIQDVGQTHNIVTVPISGAVSPDPHVITVSRAVTIEAAAGENIGLLMGEEGRHFIIQNGDVTIGNPESTGVLTLNGQATVFGQRGGLIVLDSTLTMHDGAVITNSGSSAVDVNANSTFTMIGGYIIDNITNNYGAGVVIYNGGVFNMSGGTISGNEANGGGGVTVWDDSEFNMSGGIISGNEAIHGGGGVYLHTNGTFIISGDAVISGNEAAWGGGVSADFGSEIIMSGGTISGNEAQNGGGVYVGVISDATFTLSGGTISGNKAQNGSGVLVGSGSEFTMSDGYIVGNEAYQSGGGVKVLNSEFNMSNGTINGNEATWGGGVVVDTDSEFVMSGGTISNNEATHGGGVHIVSAEFTMTGDAMISGNTSAQNGGGVLVDSASEFNMTGGEISSNESLSGGGGGVAMVNASTFEMSGDAVINGNTTSGGGGGVMAFTGDFTMTGGTISGNTAVLGGGVNVFIGEFIMTDGEISGNNAGIVGGGVRVDQSDFTMTGGEISDNTADNGGGVSVHSDGEFAMGGDAAIIDNHAAFDGGGIWIAAANRNDLTIANTAVFSGNTANGIYDFGLTDGLADFSNIRWVGYAVGTNSTPNPSHLINNFDINNVAPLVFEINVWHMINGNYQNATLFEHQSWPVESFLATIINRNATGLPYTTRDPFRGLWFNFGTMANHNRDLPGSFAERSTGDNFTSYIDIDWGVPGVAIDPAYINKYLFNIMLEEMFGLPAQYPGITSFNGSIDIFVNFMPQPCDNTGPSDMIKEPDRMVTRIGEAITWTLRGFHNRSGEAVSDFTIVDMPGRGLNFQSGSLPAFANGAGVTYEIRYRVFGSNVWHVHQAGINASQPFNFTLPQPGNLYYTEIGFFFGDVPADFGLNNQIVLTFRVGAGAPNNMLRNDFVVRYGNIERPGNSPNDPIVVTPGGGGPGGTIITDPRVALGEIFSPYHNSFLIGMPDGTIRPHGDITRAEVATVLFRLLDDNFRTAQWSQQNRFSDVHINQWFNNAVSTMANADILEGFPDGTFRGNQAITRAEFVAMVARFLEDTSYTDSDRFNDIEGHWAREYINVVGQHDWIRGFAGGDFRPDQSITRAEAAAIVNRMLGRLPETSADLLPGMVTWPDNMDTNAWFYLYIQEATNSNYFEMKADGVHKTWTELREPRDWTVLERPDSRPQDIR